MCHRGGRLPNRLGHLARHLEGGAKMVRRRVDLADVEGIPECYGLDLLSLARGEVRTHHDIVYAEIVGRRVRTVWKDDMKTIWSSPSQPKDWTMQKRGDEANALRKRWREEAAHPIVNLVSLSGVADQEQLKALEYIE